MVAFKIKYLFKLRRPCDNCPFLKEGSIELRPGRLEDIIETIKDDRTTFHCHKTLRRAQKQEVLCAGAMIYLEKLNRPSIMMRLGRSSNVYDVTKLKPHFDKVIDV